MFSKYECMCLYTAVNFFLATESLSQRVTVVPSGNAPTRVSPSLTLSPKKNSLVHSSKVKIPNTVGIWCLLYKVLLDDTHRSTRMDTRMEI
jgi:hypothetical protein